MAIYDSEEQQISLEDAAKLTGKFRQSVGTGTVIAGYFSKDSINQIFEQAACMGLRFYYGITDDNKRQIIVVGVDSDGNDLYEGIIMEHALTCPPHCSSPNPLNT